MVVYMPSWIQNHQSLCSCNCILLWILLIRNGSLHTRSLKHIPYRESHIDISKYRSKYRNPKATKSKSKSRSKANSKSPSKSKSNSPKRSRSDATCYIDEYDEWLDDFGDTFDQLCQFGDNLSSNNSQEDDNGDDEKGEHDICDGVTLPYDPTATNNIVSPAQSIPNKSSKRVSIPPKVVCNDDGSIRYIDSIRNVLKQRYRVNRAGQIDKAELLRVRNKYFKISAKGLQVASLHLHKINYVFYIDPMVHQL